MQTKRTSSRFVQYDELHAVWRENANFLGRRDSNDDDVGCRVSTQKSLSTTTPRTTYDCASQCDLRVWRHCTDLVQTCSRRKPAWRLSVSVCTPKGVARLGTRTEMAVVNFVTQRLKKGIGKLWQTNEYQRAQDA